MKTKLLSLVCSLLLMVLFVAPVSAQEPIEGDKFVLGENFTLSAGQTVSGDVLVVGGNVTTEKTSLIDGDLAVAGGNVFINGDVEGDIAVFGGNITIEGTVDGDIAVFGGNAEVKDNAVVDGDIGLVGGQAIISEKAKINGQVAPLFGDHTDERNFANDDDFLHDFEPPIPPIPPIPAPDGFASSVGRGFFGLLDRILNDIVGTISLLVVLALMTWLVAAFMPEQMVTVRRAVIEAMPASFGLGLITVFVTGFVGVLLLITICLAFIPILVWLGLGIAMLFGWVVIGQILGERLLVASGRDNPGFVASSIVGVVVLTILTNMPVIGEIPCIGFLLGFVGAIAGAIISLTGVGAVLLTRFGTRSYPELGYRHSVGPSPRPAGSGGPRVRWTDPAPNVSDEDALSSEAELNAKIKAALAEVDQPKTDDPDKGEDD